MTMSTVHTVRGGVGLDYKQGVRANYVIVVGVFKLKRFRVRQVAINLVLLLQPGDILERVYI